MLTNVEREVIYIEKRKKNEQAAHMIVAIVVVTKEPTIPRINEKTGLKKSLCFRFPNQLSEKCTDCNFF